MSSSLQLLSFPSELLIMGLQHLGYRDLIVCSMICKRFHKLVKETAELSYTVELGVDGFVDGPPNHLSTSDRLRILLDLRSRWHTLDWVKRETIKSYPTRPRHRNMHYAQGIFSQAMCPSVATDEGDSHFSIFSTILPTRATEAVECGSLGDDSLWYRAFCMDPTADVVIFVVTETLFHNASLQYLSFGPRSLSSNGTRLHPSCQSKHLHQIPLIPGAYNARISDPHIAGDMVGVTVTDDGENSIVIYNWQSGELVLRITSCLDENRSWSVRDFAFLSSRSFVLSAELSNGHASEGALLLFTFCDKSSDGAPWTVATNAVKHIVTLLLPEVAEGQHPSGYINTTPCISYQPRGIPFKVEDPCRILVYDAGSSTNPLSVRMVIHTDVFGKARKLLSTGSTGNGRRIPWDAWGPEYTRAFMHKYIDFPQKPIHGERVVMQLTDTADTYTAQSTYLLDFNRGAHRRRLASGDHDPMLVTQPAILEASLFTKPIKTALPYTAARIPNADVYSSFLLDEQRLLGLKGLQPVRETEAFVF